MGGNDGDNSVALTFLSLGVCVGWFGFSFLGNNNEDMMKLSEKGGGKGGSGGGETGSKYDKCFKK